MLALGVLLTCTALLGIALSALVFRRPDPQGLAATDLGLIALVLVLALVAWRRLDLRNRWRAMVAEAEGPVAVPAAAEAGMTAPAPIGEKPGSTTEPPPSGPANRAA